MRAMGIDPGTAICGFGIVDAQGSRLTPVTYGTIQTTPDHSDGERLVTIFEGLNELYAKYKPDIIGVEQLFSTATSRRPLPSARPAASFS